MISSDMARAHHNVIRKNRLKKAFESDCDQVELSEKILQAADNDQCFIVVENTFSKEGTEYLVEVLGYETSMSEVQRAEGLIRIGW